jgi:putative membrane-bound dehydrogenase-like protein
MSMEPPRRQDAKGAGLSFPFLVSGFLLLALGVVRAQLSPEEAVKAFQLGNAGMRVELVAAEPLVESPCAIAYDEKGRLFVAENRGYPNTAEPPQGRIALLTDGDGDGKMDARTTFANGLTFPNGVLPWRGGVIVTCAPDVLFLRDTDGDGRADERRVLLTGFDTKGSTQLRVNAPTLGPDGWIYLAAGLRGGTITCPEHPERPALKMTSDVRFHPDSLEVENADGRSQYGMSFDDYGRRFICMNRVPVQQVVLSSKWLARNPRLAFTETVQDCSERTVKTGLRGGGDGVRLFPISKNITTADSHAGSFSAACGIFIWRDGALPDDFRDQAFTCDPTANLVHLDKLTPGIAVSAAPMFHDKEFLASSDDWFRPVFLACGPEGALTIADMMRKVIEHPEYLPEEVRKRTDFDSGKALGRIWRVWKPESDSARAKAFGSETAAELVARMDTRNGWEMETAIRLLIERRPAGTVEALRSALDSPGSSGVQFKRLRALAVLGPIDDEFLERMLRKSDEGIHTAALWLAAERGALPPKLQEAVIARSEHAQPSGDLLPCLLALGGCNDARALAALAKLMQWQTDRWTWAAAESSLAGREQAFLDVVVKWICDPKGEASDAARLALLAEAGRLAGRATESARAAIGLVELQQIDFSWRKKERKVLLVGFVDGAFPNSGAGLEDIPRDVALDEEVPATVRLAAIRVLSRTGWDDARPALARLLESSNGLPSESEEIRLAAIRGIASYDPDEAVALLLSPKMREQLSMSELDAGIGALISRPGHARRILAAVEKGTLPAKMLSGQRRDLLLKHKDAEIRTLAEKLFAQAAGDRQKAFEGAKAALALRPDAAHGRELFRNVCASCHRLDREGYAVGPDLLDIRGQPKENILFHIVIPDAEISPTFAAHTVEMKDGRSLLGLLASETASSLTLRMPGGQEETLSRVDVAKIEALPSSLMPAGLEGIGEQSLADLLAFLKGEAPR